MPSKRNIYLAMVSAQEAQLILSNTFSSWLQGSDEVVDSACATGRVTSSAAMAQISSPNFHAAAMDGFAVLARDTFPASETAPVELKINSQAYPVNTGHVLPENCDAVIMIEDVHQKSINKIEIRKPSFPWQHVRKMGEDIVATELILPKHHEVTPYCIGALLAGGVYQLPVFKKPEVVIIPTGSELVQWQDTPPGHLEPGQVLETNSIVLAGMVEACGAIATRAPAILDETEAIAAAVAEAYARGADMVLTIGGSSAGSKDFAKAVAESIGTVLVHGVTMMPGKPVLAAKILDRPFFGIPGYPVSAILAFEELVAPLLRQYQHKDPPQVQTVHASPIQPLPSKLGFEEFVRVKLGEIDNQIIATPLPRGAGLITSLTEADGIIRIPASSEGVPANTPVKASCLKNQNRIKKTVVTVGSHDNSLDVLADHIRNLGPVSLSSSHVGSMGGLMAIKNGTCHMAGSHLLDPEDGTYNISFIHKFLKGIPVKLVHLVDREQGFIVRHGNPKHIFSVNDIARPDLRFMNRQSGSGTRILFDYALSQANINADQIPGYMNEEYTHMAIAAAVSSGRADAGMGIRAAAVALGLDFIPLTKEKYQLIIPEKYFDTENIQMILQTIRSDKFKAAVNELGGYATENTGEIVI